MTLYRMKASDKTDVVYDKKLYDKLVTQQLNHDIMIHSNKIIFEKIIDWVGQVNCDFQNLRSRNLINISIPLINVTCEQYPDICYLDKINNKTIKLKCFDHKFEIFVDYSSCKVINPKYQNEGFWSRSFTDKPRFDHTAYEVIEYLRSQINIYE